MPALQLVVNGEEQDSSQVVQSTPPGLVLKKSIQVSSAQRSIDAKKTRLDIEKTDLVELEFEDGTKWLAPPETLEDFYGARLVQKRGEPGYLEIPSELDAGEGNRSLAGKIALKVLNLFSTKPIAKSMNKLAGELEDKQLGSLRGLCKINGDFELATPRDFEPEKPFLLFIHGTNSSTAGSFAEIKTTDLWKHIQNYYGKNVLAFQHESMTKSPLQNAAELVEQLPDNCILHVITHSRGGLVGEVLARFSNGTNMGFSQQEISLLESENRQDDLAQLQKLQKLSPRKKFKLTKFIRVASPSSGTTILSKRLDHFLNISLNLIGLIPPLATSPVYVAMKALLVKAVREKDDINALPGLEAMNPDSPFITILNNQNSSSPAVDMQIVAISGNCKMKPGLKALFIIASKLFYQEPNDLVVNTPSMYNGSRRLNKLQFFFDEGADVDHFSYFKNANTNKAILFALQSPTGQISGFSEFSRGTLGEAERNALLGLDGGEYSTGDPSGTKPIIILLPGIMGSALYNKNGLLWIDYLKFLAGGLTSLSFDQPGISTHAIIKTSYQKLGDALQDKYDVVSFAFDWRQPMEKSAAVLNEKIISLLKMGQPIKIIGHSMGGVLVRDFMAYHPDTWQNLNNSADFRLIFLGSPLGGSFRIPVVLFGEDDIIRKLAKIDILHTRKRLVGMFDKFPGILSLLPNNTDKDNDFSKAAVWEEMKKALGDPDWPLPGSELADFGKYRDKVRNAKSVDFSNAIYVAGHDPKGTPCGYRIEETASGRQLVFLSTAEGDQSVTWESGIPAELIEKGRVYYCNYTHGALANTPELFGPIREILEKGETTLLSKDRPVTRGDQRVFKKPSTQDFDYSPQGLSDTLMGISRTKTIAPSETPVTVRVSHGDLKYCSYPIIAGHFKNDGVLYAEARIDQLLQGALSQQQKLGIYPGDIGTHEIVLTYADGFPGTIIVGLHQPDSLTGQELARSVEMSVLKYLIKLISRENLNGSLPIKQPYGLSSLVIASGYGGLSIENSVASILQGVINANGKIRTISPDKISMIETIEFIELYEDKALNCMYAVKRLAKENGGTLNIKLGDNKVNRMLGAKKLVVLEDNRDWWTRITINRVNNKKGDVAGISFAITTGAAREEQRTIFTSTGVVEGLMEDISTDNQWSEEKSRAVFELLVPNDFKNRLKRHENIIWVLDKYTAGFPWELLQDKSQDAKPLCINAGMIRQLTTGNARVNIETVPTNTALVIGDPDLKGFVTQLPGAYKEATEIVKLMKDNSWDVRALLHDSPGNIIPALVSRDYKIIHLAGHGIFNEDPEKPSGMVIGKNSFLTTAEIAQMSATPELVFVNCCFLGKTNGMAEEFFQSRFKLAANIGTQLIENGVKAVIVAGWAVDDAAALDFARKFYQNMFSGLPFHKSVRMAREDIYTNYGHTNTWGAYQTYGDPFYRLHETAGSTRKESFLISEQAENDLSNLLVDLHAGDIRKDQAERKLKAILEDVDRQELRTPAITEREAFVYKELNEYDQAIAVFEELLLSENASFSFVAAEQYCSLKIKNLVGQIDAGASTKKIEAQFEKTINDMQALIQLNPSVERYNLLASAWKRRIVFFRNNRNKTRDALEQSAKYYDMAFRASGLKDPYPYLNWVTLKALLAIAQGEPLPAADIAVVQRQLKQFSESLTKAQHGSNYWDTIVAANIQLTNWLLAAGAARTKADLPASKQLIDVYRKTWEMAGTFNEKSVELQHLDLVIQALKALNPKSRTITAVTGIRNELNDLIQRSK